MDDRRLLSRSDVAKMLGVTSSTVTRWAKLGLIPTVMTIGGHHRYFESDIQRLAKELSRGRLAAGYGPRPGEGGQAVARRQGVLPRAKAHSPEHPRSGNGSVDLVEIRWHGRGGQGVVTASQILAEAALLENRYFQAFPEFGPERTGAPVRAFTRLSSEPITLHCPVASPSIVVVLDSTLLTAVDVFEGLQEGGTAVINTPLEPQALKATLSQPVRWRVVTVDATRIAMDSFNRKVPNTPMLGALLRMAPVVSKESCLRFIQSRLGARLAPEIVEANVRAFQQAYAEAREG